MIKKLFFSSICILLLFITGCSNNSNQADSNGKIYLNDKYYNEGNFIYIKKDDLSNLKKENFILFTYNNYCSLAIPCDEIFQDFMSKYKIDFLAIPFDEFKETKYYDTVKFAPSIIIVNKDNIIAYLDANSDIDLEKYQDVNKFEEWLNNYVNFSK